MCIKSCLKTNKKVQKPRGNLFTISSFDFYFFFSLSTVFAEFHFSIMFLRPGALSSTENALPFTAIPKGIEEEEIVPVYNKWKHLSLSQQRKKLPIYALSTLFRFFRLE
jgi:hypothetical protein